MIKAKIILTLLLFVSSTTTWAEGKKFTAAEQQQISIATPGLFDRSDAFSIDMSDYITMGYSFPLPVGKATITKNNSGLQITTKKGDAVKAMFDGDVRLSYKHKEFGNIIVIRHDNGLETVYGDNAQNLVQVGDHVKAGQTIAIVGGIGQDTYLSFAIMVNGRRINPETILELNSHKLKNITLNVKKNGERIQLSTIKHDGPSGSAGLMAYTGEDSFAKSSSITIDLSKIPEKRWAWPLPGSKVISPYGGARKHSGVDLKTKPNDEIVAAFDGKVLRSGPFSGYGNCIEIEHANGFRTLYSHQSKNLVKVGDIVKAGQVIGLTGRTGRATTEHLHFEVFCGGVRYDPAKLYDYNNRKLKNIVIKITKGSGMKTLQ